MFIIGDILHNKRDSKECLYGKDYEGNHCFSVRLLKKERAILDVLYHFEVLDGDDSDCDLVMKEPEVLENYYLVKRKGINFK